ncbi:MAG: MarR family transcriptional regulator [Myxococcota bacterium]
MGRKDADYRRRLDEARRESTAQLLFKCARRVNEIALDRLPDEASGLRPAHTALFPYLRLEGIRQTELAARLGITKQAVGPLIADLETMGLVSRVPDPADRRAKLVVWTDAGREAMLLGLSHLRAIEREFETALGTSAWRHLREGLLRLHDHLDDAS